MQTFEGVNRIKATIPRAANNDFFVDELNKSMSQEKVVEPKGKPVKVKSVRFVASVRLQPGIFEVGQINSMALMPFVYQKVMVTIKPIDIKRVQE